MVLKVVLSYSSLLTKTTVFVNNELYDNTDGSIVDAKVVRSVDPYLDKEALRVINTMPKWKPGMQRGKPVRVKFTVPVMFRLQ